MNRGRGKFGARGQGGGGARGRGGGGARGGVNQSGPLYTDHLRDLDMELELLQRKRQIIEQEQNMLDRFTNNTINYSSKYSNQQSSNNYSNSNARQYDDKQPFYKQQGSRDYNSVGNPNAPRSGNSNTRSQGVKRQQVWEAPSPPKRFNAPQRVNPWQNQALLPEPRAVNSFPPQTNHFSAQPRPLMNLKPSIGQRITNKHFPQPERKNFKPSKVTKPNQKSNNPSAFYTSQQTKKLIEETNKLIAHTNTLMVQNPKPKPQNPNPTGQVFRKKPNPVPQKKSIEDNNILRPNTEPFGPLKGRLELALGTIVKSIKELCTDGGTLQMFGLPFIQRIVKHTIRTRIKEIMMNKAVSSVNEIVDNYRQVYPKETDYELMKLAQDADKYSRKNRSILQLIEKDDPDQFFTVNFNKILTQRLDALFEDVKCVYAKRVYNIEDTVRMFANASEVSEVKDEEKQDGEIVNKDDNEEKIDTDAEKGSDEEKKDTAEEKKNTDEEKKDTDQKKDIVENKDTDEEKVVDKKNETDGDKDIENQKDANEENNQEGGEDTNEQNNGQKSKNTEEIDTSYMKKMVEDLHLKKPNTKYYYDFVDKLLEKRLPLVLPKFKDVIMSILCSHKEFVNLNSLILMELKEKIKVQKLQKMECIIVDDDNDTTSAPSESATATSAKPATATNSSVITGANKTPGTTPAKSAETPATPGKSPTAVKASSTTPSTKAAATAASATPKAAATVAPATPKAAATVAPATPKAAATVAPATPKAAASAAPATPIAAKSVPSTPKAANSKDVLYVKLIGRPALPARAVIYEFLNKFKPTSIKKHKSVNNLLVLGFVDKEGYDNILSANGTVVGESTLITKASEQVTNTPTPKKTEQQVSRTLIQKEIPVQIATSEQETTNIEAAGETAESKTTDEVTEIDSTADGALNTSDILSEFDSQINDLLTSIRQADEENDSEVTNSADVDKMDTETEVDNEIAETKSDENNEEQAKDDIKTDPNVEKQATDDISDQNKEKPTSDTNENPETDKSDAKCLDTIMEVDDGTKKAKAATDAVKGVKESSRATPTRSSSRLANVTPSTIKTRRASRLANNN